MMRDYFNFIQYMKNKGYFVEAPTWTLSKAVRLKDIAEELTEVSGKVSVSELEVLLARTDTLVLLEDY